MKFRHEWKHEMNPQDLLILRSRLRTVLEPDSHAVDGKYEIRSLYFDNLQDKVLREKRDGISKREKFRLRYYNGDISLISLEKKSKINGLCNKQKVPLTLTEIQSIFDTDFPCLLGSEKELLRELGYKMQTQGLRPKTIVDYTREPFTYAPGNVRVTLDYNLRTGLFCTDFLNPDCITIPAGDAPAILEVKWDEFLPSLVRDLVQMKGRQTSSFSKYAACRIYG